MNSQENIDTIGTESNTNINENQSGGGFLSSLFNSGNKKLITKAFANDNVNAVVFLLEHDFEIDCCYVDDNNKNALHYMVQHADYNECINNKLVEVLEKGGIHSSCINHQDCDGNTPFHLAVQNGNDQLATLLEKCGADKSIRNNEGDYIEEIKEEESGEQNVKYSTNIFIKTENKPASSRLGSIMNLLNNKREQENPTETIGFNRQDAENDDSILTFDVNDSMHNTNKPQIPQMKQHHMPQPMHQSMPPMPQSNDTNVVDNKANNLPVSADTDMFINDIFSRLKQNNTQQTGGASSRRNTFNRKITTYSDVNLSEGGDLSTSNYNFESSISDLSEYANEKSKKNEIHQEAIDKIMKLLKTDDEKLAKSYKAILYKKVKDDNPDLSGLDRATKMLKLVKKSELNKISQEDIDPIYKYLSEKVESKKSKSKKRSKKVETTESESDSDMSNMNVDLTISSDMSEQAYLTLASDLSQY